MVGGMVVYEYWNRTWPTTTAAATATVTTITTAATITSPPQTHSRSKDQTMQDRFSITDLFVGMALDTETKLM